MCLVRVLLAVLLCCGVVRAADQPVSPEVKKHVDLGVEHYEAGRYAEASREFQLGYKLSNKAGLLFNIARCEGKLGHDEEAIAFLRRYLEERPDAPDASAVLAEIEAREHALQVTRDKQKAETEAAIANKKAAESAAQAERERQARLTMPPPAPPQKRISPALRPAGIALLVTGPVLLGVGIGLGVVATQSARDVATGSGEFSGKFADLEALGRATMGAGIALDVVGGAAAAIGAGLLGWSMRGASDRRAWIAPGVSSISAGGTF